MYSYKTKKVGIITLKSGNEWILIYIKKARLVQAGFAV
jgi:hypothetical protein